MNWLEHGLEPFDWLLRIVAVQLRYVQMERPSGRDQLQTPVSVHDSIKI